MTDWVQKIFGNSVGYAVEAGAYDGIFLSETLTLEQQGWSCLCIEPNPNMWEQLTKNRSLCQPYALSNHSENNVSFEIYSNLNLKITEASFSSLGIKEDLLRTFQSPELYQEIVVVNVRTLDYCLQKADFPRVDILSLDVEGWELVVLEGFDISYWNPQLLIIENIYADKLYREYMLNNGYILVERCEYNDFYIKDIKDVK